MKAYWNVKATDNEIVFTDKDGDLEKLVNQFYIEGKGNFVSVSTLMDILTFVNNGGKIHIIQ